MPLPLQQHVTALQKQLFRRKFVAGLSLFVAAVLFTGLALGLLDYFLRLQDVGTRVLFSTLFVSTIGYSLWKVLIVRLRNKPTDVSLVRNVEALHPEVGDLLSNAIAFSNNSTKAPMGSEALRRAVIVEASSRCDDISWNAVLPKTRIRRALLLCVTAMALVALLALFRFSYVQTAAARLLNPLGDDPWPRKNHLVVQNPKNEIAFGETLEVEVSDQASTLPKELWFHYKTIASKTAPSLNEKEASEEIVSKIAMTRVNDSAFVALKRVTQSLQYRITGGDDFSMPWQTVKVVEPPRIASLQIRLQPPAYTGYATYPSQRHIRALEGTAILLAGEATKPLQSVRIIVETGETIAVRLHDDKKHFSLSDEKWLAKKSSFYTIELKDAHGILGGTTNRFALRVSSDPPPTILWEAPQEDLYVTPSAEVPLQWSVKDNLAIREVALTYSRSDISTEQERRVLLFKNDNASERPVKSKKQPSHDPLMALGEQRQIAYRWNLQPLKLKAGVVIQLRGTAKDFKPTKGQTLSTRRLMVVTPTQLEDHQEERQEELVTELLRALAYQQKSQEKIQAIRIQLKATNHISSKEQDTLQAVLLDQQSIERILVSKEGLPRRIAQFLAEMENNKIADSETEDRLQQLSRSLDHLRKRQFPEIRRNVIKASKVSGTLVGANLHNSEHAPEFITTLQEIEAGQESVIHVLQQLIQDYNQWAGFRQFAREISQILLEQKSLVGRTADTLKQGQKVERTQDWQASRKAEFLKIAALQGSLARQLESLSPRMSSIAQKLAKEDPLTSQTLLDAIAEIEQRAIPGTMEEARRHLVSEQSGQALQLQNHAAADIEEVLNILRNQKENNKERLVKKITAAEEELHRLRKSLDGLLRKKKQIEKQHETTAAEKEQKKRSLKRLAREERELQEKLSRLARKLKRLTAEKAADLTKQAAERLGKDSEEGQGENGKQASADLEEAQKQLAEKKKQAEQDLENQRHADMTATLQAFVEQQQRLVDETKRIETLRKASGKWTFGQLQTVGSLGEEEALLGKQVEAEASRAGGLGVLRFSLRQVLPNLQTAARLLAEKQAGDATQNAEETALTQLQQILSAFESTQANKSKRDKPKDNQKDGAGGKGQNKNNQNTSLKLAELLLLKTMQIDLRRQTLELNGKLADNEAAANLAKRKALAKRQTDLAELIFSILDKEPAKINNKQPNGDSDDSKEPTDDLPDLDEMLEQDFESELE